MARPLYGVKILDFTRMQNGPHATVMLSDLGAEILKVERPGEGDMARQLGRQPDGFCAYFEANNRGKKSITLDLAKPETKEIVGRFLREYDVVTENFRPGLMDSLGLGYEDLREINPTVIYASSSGFGPTGKWRDAPAFDLVAQGFGGAMVTQGGGPGHTPQAVRFSIGDQVGSIIFAYAVLAAVIARFRFGIGQRVDSSLIGPQVMLQHSLYVRYLHLGEEPSIGPDMTSPGTIYGVGPTYSWYQAGDDKWFILASIDPEQWPDICRLMDRPELIEEPRSANPFARRENESWLYGIMTEAFRSKSRSEWLELFREREIPVGPIYSLAEAAEEEQFWENGYLANQDHPHFGQIGVAGIPFSLSETPAAVGPAGPELGQHTEETLLQFGYSWEQIEALRENGVI